MERARITVVRPGLLTTIQDLGRYGFQQYGVTVGGAVDGPALRIANWLAGNDEGAAALEMTLAGPVLRFETDALIALSGADFHPTIDGVPVPLGRPIALRAGAVLSFSGAAWGSRAYLAVAGGLDVPEVMGSRSTDLRARLGGLQGRALREGDVLTGGWPSRWAELTWCRLASDSPGSSRFQAAPWQAAFAGPPGPEGLIRVIRGRHYHLFEPSARERFFSAEYLVTPQSDRMGYRLRGPALTTGKREELISEAVCTGTIQVPPDGQPIILLADRQTTGGYPEIALVATVDLPRVGQAKPGDRLRFREISVEEAQRLYLRREEELERLKLSIRMKADGIRRKGEMDACKSI